jgi:putative thiamine transport system permease protein
MAGQSRSPLQFFPYLTLAAFLVPVLLGLAGTWLPALGYLPTIGAKSFTLQPWRDLLDHPSLPGALSATLVSGMSATLLSVFISLWITTHLYKTASWSYIERALAPLLAIPHAAFALGLSFLVAPSGWLIRLVSPWLSGFAHPPDWSITGDPLAISLTVTMIFKEVPFLLLLTIAALNQLDVRRTLWVGRSLGFQEFKVWTRLIIPQLYPMLRLPVLTVLAYSLSVVDLALIIGPSLPPPFAVLIDRWFNDPDISMRLVGGAGATLLFLLISVLITIFLLAERIVVMLSRPLLINGRRRSPLGRMNQGARLAAITIMAAIVLSFVLLVVWSFTGSWRFPDAYPQSLSLFYWVKSLPLVAGPLATAALVGVLSACIAVVLVLGCLENERYLPQSRIDALSRGSIWVIYLPLLIPQIGFLFGIQTILVRLHLEGSWFSLVWIHLVFVLPYIFLTIAATYRTYDQRYAQVAAILSGSPLRSFFRVKLVMLAKPILFSLAIGFAVSIAQYLPTLYVGAGRFSTITTETVSLAGGSDRRVIAVYALCQFLLPFLVYALAIGLPALLFRNRQLMKN